MFNLLRHCQNLFLPSKRRQPRVSPIACEALEVRRMLTANLGTGWYGNTLWIVGTESKDTITVRPAGATRISIDGVSGTFDRPALLMVKGEGENDVIYNDTSVPMEAWGGAGEDRITGGHANDRLFGQGEFDIIRGRGGEDVIRGGEGNDWLYGHLDDAYDPRYWDSVDGQGGADRIEGSFDLDGYEYENGVLKFRSTDQQSTIVIVENGPAMIGVRGATRAWSRPGSILVQGGSGVDSIYNDTSIPMVAFGGNGKDVITGGHGNDQLFGEGEFDIIRGRGGEDVIRGGEGNDELYGHLNDAYDTRYWDSVDGQGGDDKIEGSSDLESYEYENGVLKFRGTNQQSAIVIVDNGSTAIGVRGANRAWNRPGSILVQGGSRDDAIYNDTSIPMVAFGGNGNDVITGGHGNDQLFGEGEGDTIRGRSGEDVIRGGEGNDWLYGHLNDAYDTRFWDSVDGQGGEDRIEGSSDLEGYEFQNGVLKIGGTDRDNTIVIVENGHEAIGVRGANRAWSRPQSILVRGGVGDDTVYNDTNVRSELDGGIGSDSVTGGFGDDVIVSAADRVVRGRGGNDTLIVNGTAGADEISFHSVNGELSDEFVVQVGEQSWSASEFEMIESRGGEGNDTIVNMTAVPSRIYGDGGDDNLLGGIQADRVSGDDGDDNVDGGWGDDELWGGIGADTFIGGPGSNKSPYLYLRFAVQPTIPLSDNDKIMDETYIQGDVVKKDPGDGVTSVHHNLEAVDDLKFDYEPGPHHPYASLSVTNLSDKPIELTIVTYATQLYVTKGGTEVTEKKEKSHSEVVPPGATVLIGTFNYLETGFVIKKAVYQD